MSSLAAIPSAEPRVPRHKVFLPTQMIDGAETVRIHLLNLSTTGALAHGEQLPRPGSVVTIRCADTTWLARIVWAHDKRFGFVHVFPLASATVAELLGS